MDLLKFIAKSLISNQTIIDEEKKRPWWLSIVTLIVAVLISLIPTLVSNLSVNGADVITTSENCEIDYSLEVFAKDYLATNEITMKINNGELETNMKDGYTTDIYYQDDITLVVAYTDLSSNIDATIEDIKESYVNDLGKRSIKSMLIFTKEVVYLATYDSDATVEDGSTYVKAIYGNYKNIKSEYQNLNKFYPTNVETSEALSTSLDNFKEFFNEAYTTYKINQTLITCGIYTGLNVGIILIMSLAIFLMSLPKSSVRRFTYLEALKIAGFASLSPAIVAVILGFILSQFSAVSFVLCEGLRLTWLAMKATSPSSNQQQAAKK